MMMNRFTWEYQGVKVLITSLYLSAITAINSTILLMNYHIKISQLPVTNVMDGIKLRIITVILLRSVLVA